MRDPRFTEAAVDEAAALERDARLAARVAAQSLQDWPRRRRAFLTRNAAVPALTVAVAVLFWPGLIVAAVAAVALVASPTGRWWWQQGCRAELHRDRRQAARAYALHSRALDALMEMDPERLPLDED